MATTGAKVKAAEALAPMLEAFRLVDSRPLKAVLQIWAEGSLEKLLLDFGHVLLTVTADENDDSIALEAMPGGDSLDLHATNANHMDPWKELIGKPFGWGWITVNQQGYCDGFLLSFQGISPQVILNVVASSIKVGRVSMASDWAGRPL